MRWLPLLIVLAACTNHPARDTLPVVHVICLANGGPILDQYMTRAQFEKLAFTAAIPCVFEWGESFPGPQLTATPLPTPPLRSPDGEP